MEKRTKTRALSILAAGGIASAALWTGLVGGDGIGGPDQAAAEVLEPFSSCDELLEYADDHRWANDVYPIAMEGDFAVATEAAGGALPAVRDAAVPQAAESGAVGSSVTGTNVQEAGIDEPDIAKLSGTTLFVIRGDKLISYDVSGEDAVVLDELELPFSGKTGPVDPYESYVTGAQLLLAGDRALAIGSGWGRGGARTEVIELDVSEPDALSALRTLRVEGAQVSARLQGSTARLVVESQPDYPREGDASEPPAGATGETGPAPADEDEPDWLPQASLQDLETGEQTSSALTDCEGISFPDEFSGLGLLSVLTIDLESGLAPADTDSVMTDGHTVYASAESIYVATQALTPPNDGFVSSVGRLISPDSMTVPPPPASDTMIHRFAATDGETDYAASGKVPGTLLGQFAMSESDGVLRVASTTPEVFAGDVSERAQSYVTTLVEDEGKLSELGQVGGLGPGEDIFAVRFIGDMGYVVTFEQTDPLYTVDVSDPENPETTGELKIPGYSAYLHPVADGRLLGIGQDGTQDGTLTGAHASLFDVSDPESPERVDELALSGARYSSTSTEVDHHAFLYAPEHGLAVVPVESYGRDSRSSAVAVKVVPEEGALYELSRLEGDGQIQRALMAGDRLVTVASRGVTIHHELFAR